MTEQKIIEALSRYVDDGKFPFQVGNAFIYKWECDYWALSANGETREFEIKISRADFFCDRKKEKHNKLDEGANYFYYVVPDGLVKQEEVHSRYGLIYVKDGYCKVIKKPRRLHSKKFTEWQMLANKIYWRFRQLWRDKYDAGQLTKEEWLKGFNLSLEEVEEIFGDSRTELPNVQGSVASKDEQGEERSDNKLFNNR